MENDRDLAVASVAALVLFKVWETYENNAPSLSDLRAAAPGDTGMRQRLSDSDFTIGAIAISAALLFSHKAKDPSIIFIVIALLIALSWFRYDILNSESR